MLSIIDQLVGNQFMLMNDVTRTEVLLSATTPSVMQHYLNSPGGTLKFYPNQPEENEMIHGPVADILWIPRVLRATTLSVFIFKFVGVYIDSNPCWNTHIDALTKRVKSS